MEPSQLGEKEHQVAASWCSGLALSPHKTRSPGSNPGGATTKLKLPMVTNSKFLMPYIGKPCPYCHMTMTFAGGKRPSRDHIMPKSHGYTFKNPGNKLIVCHSCKGDKQHHHIITCWYLLQRGKDRRAPIIFAFILQLQRRGVKLIPQHAHIKKKALELWTQRHKSVVLGEYLAVGVTRIGREELAISLMATWQ